MVSLAKKVDTKVKRKLKDWEATRTPFVSYPDFEIDKGDWTVVSKSQAYDDYCQYRLSRERYKKKKFWGEVVSELPRQDRIEAKLDELLKRI
ncbi:hypothetical protein OAF54_00990 [bacterium]|nr:hypothetical protein [bacterium]